MNLYPFLKPLLFSLNAESSHDLVLGTLHSISKRPALLSTLKATFPIVGKHPVNVMGLQFDNPVGLAAGLDKDARCGPAFSAMGFGFIELGTVTPLPQPGNPKPRMFRLAQNRAIINRMGFNSGGLTAFIDNYRRLKSTCICGINLGKNASTPIENALDDYRIGLQAAYPLADYISINISSPNTKNLRQLQGGDELRSLLTGIADSRKQLQDDEGIHRPIAVKIAPDMDEEGIKHVASCCVETGMDAIIATNTTLARPASLEPRFAAEGGGLSGAPLTQSSTAVIRSLNQYLDGALPIIGVGGIMNGADALEKFTAGASLVQIYTGFVYSGPALIAEIVKSLNQAGR